MGDALQRVLALYHRHNEGGQPMSTPQSLLLVAATAIVLVFGIIYASLRRQAYKQCTIGGCTAEPADHDSPRVAPFCIDDESMAKQSSTHYASRRVNMAPESATSVSPRGTSRHRCPNRPSTVPRSESVSLIAREVALQCFIEKMERRMAEQDARIDAVQRTMLQALTTVRDTVDMLKRLEVPLLTEGQAEAVEGAMR